VLAEEDVVLHCCILDPGLLRDIGNTALGVWAKGERKRVEKGKEGEKEKGEGGKKGKEGGKGGGGGREERERGREGRREGVWWSAIAKCSSCTV